MKVLAVFRYGFFFHKIVILFHASSIRVSIWIFLHEIVMHYSLCYTDCYFLNILCYRMGCVLFVNPFHYVP